VRTKFATWKHKCEGRHDTMGSASDS